jgi:hypothetical protein
MMIVIPVLALIALYHELLDVLRRVRLFAVAVAVEVVLVISVLIVFEVKFLVVQSARKGHAAVPAVASEIQLRIELYHIMAFVAIIHASDAEAVRFDIVDKLTIIWKTLLYFQSLVLGQVPDQVLIARNARVNLLIYVAIIISASVQLL